MQQDACTHSLRLCDRRQRLQQLQQRWSYHLEQLDGLAIFFLDLLVPSISSPLGVVSRNTHVVFVDEGRHDDTERTLLQTKFENSISPQDQV